MKRAIVLIALISANAHSNESCFSTKAIVDLIGSSEELDECFADDKDPCNLRKKSVDFQANVNSSRLIPMNRMAGDKFMNRTTGEVSVKFGTYNGIDSEQQFSASAQKISRCHIIAPAHLLYTDGELPIDSTNFSITFKNGQSCNIDKPFENEVSASVIFKMTDKARGDFRCKSQNNYQECESRIFRGSRDLVILKLKTFNKNDKSFFKLNTQVPTSKVGGQRINCWGYTSQIGIENMTTQQSRMFLWSQKDARMFGDKNGKSFNGVMTSAIARKGISGGGCVDANDPKILVGMFANDNKGGGDAGININPEDELSHHPNYLSVFHKLSERYSETTNGKKLEDLDSECGE